MFKTEIPSDTKHKIKVTNPQILFISMLYHDKVIIKIVVDLTSVNQLVISALVETIVAVFEDSSHDFPFLQN